MPHSRDMFHRLARSLIAGMLLVAAAPVAADPAVSALIESLPDEPVSGSARAADRAALERFYSPDFAEVWLTDGAPNRHARQALDLLREAESHGLDPADYDLPALSERVRRADGLGPQEAAELEVALTRALFRFLADLHGGRVEPKAVQQDTQLPRNELDAAQRVRDALDADRLSVLAVDAAPSFPMYGRLREALARYRALARSEPREPLPATAKLRPGMPYAGLSRLRRRLTLLGDLPASAPMPVRYQGEIVEAVRRFQARHGLDADGVVGRTTFEALNVPLSRRVRQLELALERMRWIPPLDAERAIAVNIPEFRLRAFELGDGTARIRLAMNVIVGRALDTRTPVFVKDMQYIEFSPYWNVPPSIAKGEILPKLRRDPGYLAREGMEFLGTRGERRVSTAVTPANLEALARGELQVRQRPGPKNALGDVKFVFPNNLNIYLHHTSAPALFKRARRDFSHGCIRVEDPVALAKFLLEGRPEWTEERIRRAMEAGKATTARLAEPVPVVIFYATALVEEDGRVLFLPDIYGHDEALDRALKAHRAG